MQIGFCVNSRQTRKEIGEEAFQNNQTLALVKRVVELAEPHNHIIGSCTCEFYIANSIFAIANIK
jgi:hypothetical protein